jgi:hypothetical protein
MPSVRFGVVLLLAASFAHCQTTVNTAALKAQQQELSGRVMVARMNFSTFWKSAFPNGAPFQMKNNERARMAAWSPKYERKDVAAINNGLGCIMFITKDGSDIPNLCAPVDVQANLAMEALREDWENGRRVPDGKNEILTGFVNSIPSLWAEEKTLFCLLRPEAKYIDLSDTIQNCTPEK